MAPQPVLDAETEALIAQLVVDSFEHFANGTLTRAWDPSVGPSRIGLSYHDYEEPLSSYERQVLEGADTPDLDEGWIVTETDVLDTTTAALSLQFPLSLDPDERWDPEAEASEDFKQDRIMAEQHKEVMEERVFNGLRLPSPPPTPRENRISAVAIGRQVPALEPQRRTLSPLAADFVPIFRNPTNNPRRSSSRSPGALRGCSSSDIPSKDSHMCDPKPQRCALSGVRAYDESMTRGRTRGRSQQVSLISGRVGAKRLLSCHGPSEQVLDSNGTCTRYRTDDSHFNAYRRPRNADWAVDAGGFQIPRREGRQTNTHEDLLKACFCTKFNPNPCFLIQSQIIGHDNDANQMMTRATHECKGKGKASEFSRFHDPSKPPISRTSGKAHNHTRRPTVFDCRDEITSVTGIAYDDDLSYDPKTGKSVVYIPWPRRDPEKDRINDSKVIEIHLGETSDDECEIRELFGKMSMDDLDLHSILAARQEDGDWVAERDLLDDEVLTDVLRGSYDLGSNWEEHLRDNERISPRAMTEAKNLRMASW